MINFETLESKTIALRPGDPGFTIQDNLCIVQRAGIEIQSDCPHGYALVIAEAINKGWIKPVAHIKKTEHVFNILENS